MRLRHTQEAIGEALNMPQRTISDMAQSFSEIGQVSKSAKIAAEFADYDAEQRNDAGLISVRTFVWRSSAV